MGPAARRIVLVTGCWLLAACGDDTSTRVCIGSTAFCSQAFGANRPPEAHAGADQGVIAGDRVTLDGTASRDLDGHIASYSWSQQSGLPVALSQATTSAAAFDAPDVLEPTTLVFRLVVTDDDGASDDDSVTVSVTPAGIAALRQDVARLDRLTPAPCGDGTGSARCWSYLGMWLGARVSAAALADEDPTALLDALRVIEITQAEAAPVRALPALARQLFRLGQRAVAAFTEQRDPATAERARRLAAGPPPRPDEWRVALTELNEAAALSPPEALAAGTLLRALRLGAGDGATLTGLQH